MKVQFDSNIQTDKNRQCITRYIKNWADITEIKVKYSPSLDNFIAKISWIFLSAQLGGKENLSGRPVHLFWSFIAQ